jgi:hypothetical protein
VAAWNYFSSPSNEHDAQSEAARSKTFTYQLRPKILKARADKRQDISREKVQGSRKKDIASVLTLNLKP